MSTFFDSAASVIPRDFMVPPELVRRARLVQAPSANHRLSGLFRVEKMPDTPAPDSVLPAPAAVAATPELPS